jgi:uncharacterized membrane protein
MFRGVQGAAVLAIALGSAAPCFADLTLCNKSDAKLHISVGYKKGDDGWISQGWWNLEASQCRTIVQGMPARFYYIFAFDERGRSWDADPQQPGGWFCISPEKYALRNRDYEDGNKAIHCEKDNLKAKQFKLLDTGNKIHFTQDFRVRNDATSPPAVASNPTPNAPSVATAPSPSPTGAATACQRFPNLC